jgi:copper homeostasis protein
MKRLLEVCAGSLQSALAAAAGGAERLELCAALPLDGLTPSVGLLQTVRHYCPDQRIRVLIRPREGHFVYSEAEVEAMLADIEALLLWADGIVGGALTAAGDLDVASRGVS